MLRNIMILLLLGLGVVGYVDGFNLWNGVTITTTVIGVVIFHYKGL